MKLIKKLQECSTIGQADPILTRLNAGPAVKKLVETAIILNNSQDPQQRSHAYSFMESAIKELEDDEHKEREEEMGMHGNEDGLSNKKIGEEKDDDLKNKFNEEEDDDEKERETHGENKLHEEELSNHNQGARTTGSEQSSDNTEPYPGEGKDTTNGEKPMQDMDGTINQWNETGGMPPGGGPPGAGMPPGIPMQQGGGIPPGGAMPPAAGIGQLPGLAPDVAQEMGMVMPNLPPMDTNQMMRQMQYTVKNTVTDLYRKEILPLQNRLKEQIQQNINDKKQYGMALKQQREAIKSLSQELQETKAASGSMSLDIDSLRKNSSAKFRETVTELQDFSGFDGNGMPAIQPVPNRKGMKLDAARSEIEQMDKILNSNSSIYN